ncbi:hypothetical protein QBC47DRAFT_114901 [Echria macrotheca]|uniref:Uncharacterized protein n=1 Tax=Echria macrotheca TaxID=438768 RepID=A0AAJ0BMD8_9PEZI|nr:hypothetical protein QBC47DRAFT_114901 [Echria macrotheca]
MALACQDASQAHPWGVFGRNEDSLCCRYRISPPVATTCLWMVVMRTKRRPASSIYDLLLGFLVFLGCTTVNLAWVLFSLSSGGLISLRVLRFLEVYFPLLFSSPFLSLASLPLPS